MIETAQVHLLDETVQLHEQIAALRAALKDAIECLESWSAYAPYYAKEKWDLAGDLERLRAALAP